MIYINFCILLRAPKELLQGVPLLLPTAETKGGMAQTGTPVVAGGLAQTGTRRVGTLELGQTNLDTR